LLEQTIRVTQGVIRWAQLAEGRVAGVFLVGGSSRIPLVATMLHRALGEAPVAIEQPELVVAEGSLVGGAAPTPVTAAPAPGPATGVLPRLNLSYPLPGSAFSGSAPSGRSGSAPPGSGYPVSGPPATPVSVPPARPVSAPPAGPVSAPPVFGPQSAPPVSGRQSAPPVGGRPVSSPPVSAPPGRSAGRVFVSGVAPVSPAIVPSSAPPVAPTRPMMRYEEPPGYAQQQQPVRQSRSRQRGEPRQGRGLLARAILAFLLVLLLIAVPLVACYLSYFVTTGGEWPPPVSAWLAYGPLPA
jgi:molecular chaperone DnaK